MKRITHWVIGFLVLIIASAPAFAQENDWPRTLILEEGLVTVYAPRIEALDGDTLYYRAALAYRPEANAEPIFGAGWLKSKVKIAETEGVVQPNRLELTQTRFPEGTTDIEAELATALLLQSTDWNLDFSVRELEAALEAAEAETLAAQKLKTAPPKIIYRDRPALLVVIDGKPILREIENSPYEAVINTTFPLISNGDEFYLNAAKGVWYRADKATGPYRFDNKPPRDIVEMVETAQQQANESGTEDQAPAEPVTAKSAPEIVVSTEPAELIVTEGPADFVPLVGDLLVLKNSDDDVFMHVGEQQYYIVLAGRWYRAESLNGPWQYQASDALPADFASIPEESPQADSRVYVAGTPEAEEAVLNAHVPQTAAVERGEVEIDVEYDGEPDFERVDGTDDLRYAKNTGATVLESDRTYYLLEDGVWYVATSPHGPWVVSDHRPGEVDTIEPSSPVYNTKYVYVYDATPEVVYVGYTPGYYGSYVHYNTIVYGTGWYYRPWVSPYYYYPRHSTWGYHVGYSGWGGWSFGVSWNWGPWWNVGYYTGGYWHYGRPWYNRYWGYWGPRGYCYRPYYPRYAHYGYGPYHKRHHGYRDYGYDHGYDNGYGHRRGRHSYDDYGRQRHRNLYRDDGQRARVADTRDAWNNDPDWRNDPTPGIGRRGETRYVDNKKVRQSNTGPVRPQDLQAKAQVRDINRAARREPMIANNRGEVYSASFNNSGPRVSNPGAASSREPDNGGRRRSPGGTGPSRDDDFGTRWTSPVGAASNRDHDVGRRATESNKIRQSRTEPISRNEIRRRGDALARRSDERKPSVAQPLPEPTRQAARPERRAVSQPRESNSKARKARAQRQPVAEPPQASSRSKSSQSQHQTFSQPREVRSQSRQPPSQRAVASVPRRVEQRPAQTRPSRKVEAPGRREPSAPARPQSRAPVRQVNQAPSRPRPSATPSQPRQSAPAPRSQRQNTPVRTAPARSAPARNAPPRSTPRQSAPAHESGASRGSREGGSQRSNSRDRRSRK